MFRTSAIRCVMVVGVLALVTSPMWAQTGSKSSSSKSTATKTTAFKPVIPKFRGRLPNNFGQLGLSEKQVEDIYTVQKKYHEEIEELKQRLEALEAQEDQEVNDILTAEQKTKLVELRSRFKKKATSKTKATATATK